MQDISGVAAALTASLDEGGPPVRTSFRHEVAEGLPRLKLCVTQDSATDTTFADKNKQYRDLYDFYPNLLHFSGNASDIMQVCSF